MPMVSGMQAVSMEPLIDVNVYLSRWPFRRLPWDEPAALADHLRSHGVQQAWAGSFDALLHKDIGAVNLRLMEDCRTASDLFRPVGCVNPAAADWQEDLRRCAEQFGMHAIRLHPGFHGYQLSDPRFEELLDECLKHHLVVQVVVRMEDLRTQHPLVRIADLDVAPLPALLKSRPELNVVLLNSQQALRPAVLAGLAECPRLYLDIAMQEGVGGIGRLIRDFPADRVVFGSYAPFFVLESALLKLQESELGASIGTGIRRGNVEGMH